MHHSRIFTHINPSLKRQLSWPCLHKHIFSTILLFWRWLSFEQLLSSVLVLSFLFMVSCLCNYFLQSWFCLLEAMEGLVPVLWVCPLPKWARGHVWRTGRSWKPEVKCTKVGNSAVCSRPLQCCVPSSAFQSTRCLIFPVHWKRPVFTYDINICVYNFLVSQCCRLCVIISKSQNQCKYRGQF